MNPFSKKLSCHYCGRNMKRKMRYKNSNPIYICSTYDNYGKKHCYRNPVVENWIRELLELRYRRDLEDTEIRQEVEKIIVAEREVYVYLFNDKPIIVTQTYAKF